MSTRPPKVGGGPKACEAAPALELGRLETLQITDPDAYERLKDRIRVLVAVRVRTGRTLVASKGDDELLALHDRRAEHFPQDERGRYPSSHPADGEDAVAQLEALVGGGARYLVIPATSFWWFAHYAELSAYLCETAAPIAVVRDTCAVFDLRPVPPVPTPTALASLLDALIGPGVPVSVLAGPAPDLRRPVSDAARFAVTAAPAHLSVAAPRPGRLLTSQRHVGEVRERPPA